MRKGLLYLVPIQLPDEDVVAVLDRDLPLRFPLVTRVLQMPVDLDRAFDHHRNQYYSTRILAQLVQNSPPDAARILGITGVDLFIPVLTYLYGEAQLGGIGALISTARLRNEFYGLPANVERYHERIIKEAVHELGHTYGLVHCPYPTCIMNQATYIEDVDERGSEFCKSCAAIVASGGIE